MIREYVEGLGLGLILTAITYAIGLHFGWSDNATFLATKDSWLEVIGVVLNYACVWLCVRQKMANWPLGILAVIFLGWLFYDLKLYASMVLSLAYFLPMQIWGWWHWKYGDKGDELDVSLMHPAQYIQVFILGSIAWWICYQINVYFGGSTAGLDVGILVLSIIAQWLIGLKKVENWAFWFVVNVLSVYVYSSGEHPAYLLAFQYALFLMNAVNGGYQWWRDYTKHNVRLHFGR